MRINIIIFLLSLFLKVNSQTKGWESYDLDSIVSLEMPFSVYEIDTIIDYKKIQQIYSSDSTSTFLVQKLNIEQLYSNIEMPILPKDYESLKTYYLDIIWTLDEMTNLKMADYYPIQKSNLKGYEILFVNENEIEVRQINLFLVNKNLYNFTHENRTGLKEFDRNLFFKSIYFDDKKELKQYRKNSSQIINKFFFILIIFVIISFILRILSKK